MDRRFREAGGEIGGEFGYRDKRQMFINDAQRYL